MEKVLENSGDLKKTINIAEDSAGEVRWLEEGTLDNGWQHIKTKHVDTGQFRDIGISDKSVQPKIFESISRPSVSPLKSASGKTCYFLQTGAYYIRTVVGGNGYILSSHPYSDSTFKCPG